MAKQNPKKVRKVVTSYEEEPDETPPQVPWSNDEIDEDDSQIQRILDSVGPGEIKIKILKWGPKGKSYCFSLDGGPVDEDFIQSQFGGGRYQGQIFKNGIYTGNSFELNIAERIASSGGTNGGMADVQLRMMQQQLDFFRDLAMRNSNGQQEREPINAIADAMLKMSQLQQSQAPPLPMETLLKCIELGKTLNGEGDWKSTLVEVVKESMPAIQGILSQAKPAAPQQRVIQGQQENPNGGTVEQLQVQLKAGIDLLKRKCLSGSDPGLYIDWIVDNREASPYAQLIHSVVSQPFSSFAQIDPEIAADPYKTFFTALYNGIREIFQGEGQLDVDTGGAPGNAKDVKGNGGVGAGGKKGR